ncbi:MAG: hypothetical protein A2X12_10700 [Bacteroidetes bacterium GWE2_29_8]|nr:MAG: hypothetical protein A2X12_10700 [Bacteroidetes bacterium GWE2_29_8]OFY24837.1 MAG: hypothetical protein A2X02_03830 [Bacteroidetes bacterium GWF2_29_10]
MKEKDIEKDLSSDSALYTVNKDKIITSWSKGAEDITGYKAEEIIGKLCTTFTSYPCEKYCSLFDENSEKFYLDTSKCSIITKSGERKYIKKNKEYLKDIEGNILGGIERFTDITNVFELNDQLKTTMVSYKTLFNDSTEAIYVATVDGDFIDANPAGCKLLGYLRDDVLSFNILDLVKPEYVTRLQDVYARCIMENKVLEELEIKHKEGYCIDVEMTVSLLPDNRLLVIMRDISARKQVELDRKKREEYYKTLILNSFDVIMILDESGVVKYISDNVSVILGYNKEELLGNKKALEIIHPDDLPTVMDEFNILKEKFNQKKQVQYRVKDKIGIYHWAEVSVTNLLNDGVINGILANAILIDDRKMHEERIDNLYKKSLEVNEFLMNKDSQLGRVLKELTELNQKLLKSELELKKQLKINTSLSEFSKHIIDYNSSIEKISADINFYIKEATSSEHGFVGVIDPITKDFNSYSLTEMLAGQCNIENYAHNRITFPVSADGTYNGLWGHALNTRKPFYTNEPKKHLKSVGIPLGHIPLKNFMGYPVLFDNELLGLVGLANSAEQYSEGTLTVVKSFVELYALIIYRKKLEANLRESEERSRNLAELAFEGIIIHSKDKIIEVNNSAIKILGYNDKEELIALNSISEVIDKSSQMEVFEKINNNYVGTYEIQLLKKDGTIFPAEINSVLTNYKGEKTRVISFRDIIERKNYEIEIEKSIQELEKINTDLLSLNIKLQNEIISRKKVEKELERQKELLQNWNDNLEKQVNEEVEKSRIKDELMLMQSRQAAMGEMIGNIAHQWRQPLNSLSLMVFDLKEAEKNNELNSEYLQKEVGEISQIIQHMSQTIDDFRHFFKPEKERQEFFVNEVINKAISFVNASFKDNDIIIDFKNEINIMTIGYQNEYAQVVLNIINNSKDAIIERSIQNGRVVIKIEAVNDYCVCSISDNGGGIDENILHKIFDPYFTTKDDVNGSGIGLYMSKIIIEKNMGGKLNGQNIDGGVRFDIITKLIV